MIILLMGPDDMTVDLHSLFADLWCSSEEGGCVARLTRSELDLQRQLRLYGCRSETCLCMIRSSKEVDHGANIFTFPVGCCQLSMWLQDG